jgi:ABC-type multidrug transport system fused ATPase/permease subunit
LFFCSSLFLLQAASFRGVLVWFVSVSAALAVIAGAGKLLFVAISQRMELDLRLKLFSRFLYQPIEFFDTSTTGKNTEKTVVLIGEQSTTGDLMARLGDDIRNMLAPVKYTLASVVQVNKNTQTK